VFAESIDRVEGPAEAGTEAEVYSQEGVFIARGLFNPQSAIRVRLYRWDDGPLDESLWRQRLEAALRLRRDILQLNEPHGARRLVFSESDKISGLTVDHYDRWLVAQFTSLALYQQREILLRLLTQLTGAQGIVVRTDRGVAGQEGLEIAQEAAIGDVPLDPVTIVEHGIAYTADLRAGQKTGFYLDQRETRKAIAPFASGRRVLDLFCHSGGFSFNALRHGGATHTLGIDSSRSAIAAARANAVANGFGNARFEAADAFDALERLRSSQERFGMIVCDPPKFARHPKAVGEAIKAYLRLNRSALDVLEPDGILVTCTCSGHVDRQLFAQMLGQVAEMSARPIQILEQRGQAADHPVSASCLETEYLKCFVCRVL
jgi:23S rRNA (cytosine1962-C5)-methyltransferase